jgi:hypothetical protein
MNEHDNIGGQWGVPDFYFENNKSRILQKIELESDKASFQKLYALRQNVFIVPDEYFASNAAQLYTGIRLSQYASASVFSVPENYFTTQAAVIHQKLSFLKPSKANGLLSVAKRYRMHAAAAIVVLSLSIFGLNYFGAASNSNAKTEALADASIVNGIDLEELEEHDLIEHLDVKSDELLDTGIEQQLEDEDIENSI